MENRIRIKSDDIYKCSELISACSPWKRFSENDTFCVQLRDKKTYLYFNILGKESGRNGIACYTDKSDYLYHRLLKCSRNKKHEPLTLMQNAIVGFWGESAGQSAGGAGFPVKARSKLRFEKYERGYYPVPISEKENRLLYTGLRHLLVMLDTAMRKNVSGGFGDRMIFRYYSDKTGTWEVCFKQLGLSEKPVYPAYTVTANRRMTELRDRRPRPYSVQLDFSYLPLMIKERESGRNAVPILFVAADAYDGRIYGHKSLSQVNDKLTLLMSFFDRLVSENGKPSEICVCEPEIFAMLSDFCFKTGIKLTMSGHLDKADAARARYMARIS